MIYDDSFGHWFTGLVDGEGCFHARIHIRKDDHVRCLVAYFSLKLRADDTPMLEVIRDALGVGHIYKHNEKLSKWPQADYRVNHRNDLRRTIVPHFDMYPLRSKKARDYEVWREIILKYKCRRANSLTDVQWSKLNWLIKSLQQVRGYEFIEPVIARERVRNTQSPLFVHQPQQMTIDM